MLFRASEAKESTSSLSASNGVSLPPSPSCDIYSVQRYFWLSQLEAWCANHCSGWSAGKHPTMHTVGQPPTVRIVVKLVNSARHC